MNESKIEGERRTLPALAAALALGFLHQLLFYGLLPGLSVPLFVLLLYAYFRMFGRETIRPPDQAGLLLSAAVVLLALTYALFDNPIFFVLNLLALPALIAWHLTYIMGDRRRSWHDLRLIPDAFGHVLKQTVLHVPDAFAWARPRANRAGDSEDDSSLRQVMYGLAFAVPLLGIVLVLLLSADGVLRTMAGRIPVWFGNLPLGDGGGRLLWTCAAGLFLFTYLAGFRSPKRRLPVQGPWMADPVEPAARFRPLPMVTLLISLNLVYVLFVAFQFSYLFGAWQGVLPESSSYAEYTRSGFGELIGVTLINFGVLLIGMYATLRGEGRQRRLLDALHLLLIFCSVAMLGSAFSRLLLYEEAYGYTRLRFLVHAFMIFLFAVLLLFALCIRLRRIALGRLLVVLGVCAYLAVNYACMDRVIARLNLDRQHTAEAAADLGYLMGLSSDAVPVLIERGKQEGGELDRLLREKAKNEASLKVPWPSWNVSEWRSRERLSQYVN
ncbi:DUF4153 domain-containing protein [Saccharibacillus qingshengii]|uniref:DUF4153 domain-containing protein n=1 Tax=Saccharibacillus qingshengii TaxID=1763540 RepID=UPI0015580F08|nr:DUF4173 domain-containing protein [Saccharibacillus qingshengii]